MWEHDATEVAYKNGYEKGYEQGVRDMAERIKNYYRHTTSRPLPDTVEYYVNQIAKDLLEKELIKEGDGSGRKEGKDQS